MQISTMCSVCRGNLVSDQESGEVVCSSCGLVLSDRAAETRAEWRDFGAESAKKIRTGANTSLARHDMGLATVIGKNDRDASGIALGTDARYAINRLRMWDYRIQLRTSFDKNLRAAFDELNKLKPKLGLSDAMVEKTAYIYRKVRERGMTRGRSVSAILAACIYLACRELDTPVTLKDISVISNVKRKDVSRNYRLIVLELDSRVPLVDPMKCIVKIANRIDLNERIRRRAISIMNDLAKTDMRAGKAPMCFAATVLYMSCRDEGNGVTQRAIAEAAGVTEVTIRNRMRDLRQLHSSKLKVAGDSTRP
jgi:transcription initiation factor TFIIB